MALAGITQKNIVVQEYTNTTSCYFFHNPFYNYTYTPENLTLLDSEGDNKPVTTCQFLQLFQFVTIYLHMTYFYDVTTISDIELVE